MDKDLEQDYYGDLLKEDPKKKNELAKYVQMFVQYLKDSKYGKTAKVGKEVGV